MKKGVIISLVAIICALMFILFINRPQPSSEPLAATEVPATAETEQSIKKETPEPTAESEQESSASEEKENQELTVTEDYEIEIEETQGVDGF